MPATFDAASLSERKQLQQPQAKAKEDEVEQLTGLPVLLKYAILLMICAMAFLIRLFAVVRYESVIHEFDPYFNFRTTKYLTAEGFLDFLDWFDDRGWYPLGRTIGGTIYPGLMLTAAVLYWLLQALNFTVNIRNVCVFLAPLFAANTAVASYLLTAEVTGRSGAGLLAAAFTAIVPSYISRSVGGSYDNEGVAIFALIATFWLWVRAVNTGSMLWAAAAALGYFYMVAAWGGYVFIINIVPIYTIAMIVGGRYSARLYVAYSTFYALGSLLAMQNVKLPTSRRHALHGCRCRRHQRAVPFVGFNVVRQAECAASHGVFVALQTYALGRYLVAAVDARALRRLLVGAAAALVGAVAAALVALQLAGRVQWTGRSLTLLDPTYASKYIPIIASVSEHQPTTWTSFFFDLHVLVPLAPVGLLLLFRRVTDGALFVLIYGTLSWYFAGVMVRLMLTLAPIACILAAVAMSELLHRYCGAIAYGDAPPPPPQQQQQQQRAAAAGGGAREGGPPGLLNQPLSFVVVAGALATMCLYAFHSTYASSIAYSNPSIVIEQRLRDGGRLIYDDYREAYYWLRHNTAPDAKILSWWDYGYQMSAMSNRTVIVDNNTWNNTHIATVGRALASTEEEAYPILQSLDVDYVLVIFGGVAQFPSDDINKFLWPVRIATGVFGGDMPGENDFMSATGQYDVGEAGSKVLHNCLAYKLSYYRFAELDMGPGRGRGFDLVRNKYIGNKFFELTTLEEAFTSEHWLVRIYRVLPQANLEPAADAPPLPSRTGRANAAPQKKAVYEARYVGCYYSEADFEGREYVGGAYGANLGLIHEHARAFGRRYFATARNDADGHAFVFDAVTSEAAATAGGGCERACADDAAAACGCMDAACSAPKPAAEEHNRRWAVYEVMPPKRKAK
ncbi:dolichyl-diphosphooligosaccharide--protein glycosyltransferase [Tribonema minus]|uniref:dolichyl-diphosphooligosaccharide--protein glycotransferase n=1 Tax=Tribonema minus TaxID=303371 RepID=A0A835Z1M3_9STRA|nr:dolichyl-diphosphooligosaccharide--protein glycosyltransferase [Tribonema minus]